MAWVAMGRPDYLKPEAIDLDSSFLWLVFAADVGYIPLAMFQRFYFKTYPATRHHSDFFSMIVVAVHVLCGATVIFGGCYCWLALHGNHPIIPTRVADILAMAAIAHSISNLFLLRKVPGVRCLDVPLYILGTVYNSHRALGVLKSIDGLERELVLLWCAVSTFIWVRYFIAVVGFMAGTRFIDWYHIIYTLALPFAGVLGLLLPAELLGGVDPLWTIAFLGVGPTLGPPMVGVYKICVRVREWPWVRRWGFSRWVVQFLLETTNPKAYHGAGIGNSSFNTAVGEKGGVTE